jgi:hypothetical protein
VYDNPTIAGPPASFPQIGTTLMTFPQHAAPVSGAARNLNDRVAKFETEQAEADREKALEAARTIWLQVSELIVKLGQPHAG